MRVGLVELLDKESVDAALASSCAIFKHSRRCGRSVRAYQEILPLVDRYDLDWYVVDVIAHRELSQYIAEKSGIAHASPQLIILSAGNPIYSATHERIEAAALEAFLADDTRSDRR